MNEFDDSVKSRVGQPQSKLELENTRAHQAVVDYVRQVRLVCAFQQKIAVLKEQKNERDKEGLHAEIVFDFCARVRIVENKEEQIEIFTSLCFDQASTEYEAGYIKEALLLYRIALDILEKNCVFSDDRHAIIRYNLAVMLLKDNQSNRARRIFLGLEHYWSRQRRECPSNPYPARFYELYGDFLIEINKPDIAINKYHESYQLYCKMQGEKSVFAQKIYQKMLQLHQADWKITYYSSVSPALFKASTAVPISATSALQENTSHISSMCAFRD